MPGDAPWRDPAVLRALAADWSRRLAGRPVARVEGGSGWLHLAAGARGEAAIHLLLVARPGAVLLADDALPPPPAVAAALGRDARHALAPRLAGLRIAGVAAYAADLALALRFAPRGDDPPLRLVHQLFGSRGNLLLAGDDGRLHWSAHPSPHPALLDPPSPAGSLAPDEDAAAAAARACRAAAAARLAPHLEAELGARLGRALRQAEEAAARLRDRLAGELAAAERGDDLRRAAEALAANLPAVPRGEARVTLPDPAGGPPLTVDLDPSLAPAANMETLFRRARRAERGRGVIARRLDEARARLAALAAARDDLAARLALPDGRLAAGLEWRERHADLLGRAAPAPAAAREAPEPARPFRRYRLEGRWEVWLGRDNAENDLLTLRAAAPDDIWLHAQGVPGSHAVLRAGGRPADVPRRVIEKAAALAALHSRARDAGLVPVVHTLRKYVRKPRRSAPGAVVYEREKTLFVPPVVPEGTEPA